MLSITKIECLGERKNSQKSVEEVKTNFEKKLSDFDSLLQQAINNLNTKEN